MSAARYACRCSIPLPPSGIATELTVRICTMDGYAHKSLPPDAAGNISAGSRNLTVRDCERRVRRRLAGPGPGHNRDFPKPIIGGLGNRGCDSKTGRGQESRTQKGVSDAMMAHEDDSRFCDDPAYFWTMCSKLGATQQARKFPWKQRFEGKLVPYPERKKMPSAGNRVQAAACCSRFGRPGSGRSKDRALSGKLVQDRLL
jgi:hypothetical protein